jgi:hypothetical protein
MVLNSLYGRVFSRDGGPFDPHTLPARRVTPGGIGNRQSSHNAETSLDCHKGNRC